MLRKRSKFSQFMAKAKKKIKKATQKKKPCFLKLCCIEVKKYIIKKKKTGFSLIELLIVLAIIGSLSTVGAVTFNSALSRSRDTQRKKDLATMKNALEDYYNDNACYPDEGVFDSCESTSFTPYLKNIPCDPKSKTPYLYIPLENPCKGYRLHAGLENTQDNAIAKLNCDGQEGCGYGPDYNYGVAAGVAVYDPDGDYTPPASAGPSPSAPTEPVYVYACDPAGTCNQYEEGHPYLVNCPVTYEQSNCNNECSLEAVRCGG